MYSFARDDESVEHGFRRIALSQIELALSDLRDNKSKQGSAIHAARRRCKRLRGLLRLVRPMFPDYRAENATIRDAADGLSDARDAEVMIATFDGLFGDDAGQRDRFDAVRKLLLDAKSEDAGGSDAEAALSQFAEAMTALKDRAAHWSLDRKDMQAIWPGLKAIYKAARDGMDAARDGGKAMHFHDWRKAVKYRGHHLALLRDTAPDVLAAERGLVDALGEALGDHHNLALLDERLAGDGLPRDDVRGVAELTRARMDALEKQAFGFGRQVLAERPAAMAQRMREYWASWQ